MSESAGAQPGKRLGDFAMIREIGRGGMGIVYEARQLSLNRKVALKVISGSFGLSSTAVVRFRREAEAAAKLHHTNIVPIYTTGEENGTHFYAMEYCDGMSLEDVIDRGGEIPWQVAVEVMVQVCRGLEHAHEHGIIHRDIKPANIFICRPPGA